MSDNIVDTGPSLSGMLWSATGWWAVFCILFFLLWWYSGCDDDESCRPECVCPPCIQHNVQPDDDE